MPASSSDPVPSWSSGSSAPPVLVVDDEKNVRITFRQALEDMGLAVDTAENGNEALEQIDKQDYALVLLDHRMPGPDGLEVLQELRRTKPNVPVVIVTAHGTVERAVQAVRLGAVDVLLKPITTETLNALVERVLREPHASGSADSYDEWIQLGTWHLQYGRPEAARHCLQAAIDRDETRSEAYTLLGIVEASDRHPDEARDYFEKAIEREPDTPTAQSLLNRLENEGTVRPLPRLDMLASSVATGSESEQTRQGSPESSGGEEEPAHRVVALLDEKTAASEDLSSRELLQFATLSARAHEQSELLLLMVVEVPRQVSPSQYEDMNRQEIGDLNDRLDAIATELADEHLAVRPLVVVGHTISSVVQNAIEQEDVQHLVAEWSPQAEEGRTASHYEFLDEVGCEVTLLRPALDGKSSDRQRVAAFIGESPHAPFVARRALEWAQGSGIASLTLVNGQQSDESVSHEDLRHRGHRLLWDIADRAGLEESQYEREVVVDSDLERALVDRAEDFDFVCVGASRSTSLAESIFGTVTERLLDSLNQPIAIARGPQPSHRSFIEKLSRHLTGA